MQTAIGAAIAEDDGWIADFDDESDVLNVCLSDDEEDILMQVVEPSRSKRNCIKNYLTEIVPTYTDEEFLRHFRVKRELFAMLTKRYEAHRLYQELRHDKRLPATKQMLIFLWFAGHEACSFRDLSDRFDVSISSVSRVIARVTTFVSELADEVFVWPNSAKMEETSSYFQVKCGFPKIIGKK